MPPHVTLNSSKKAQNASDLTKNYLNFLNKFMQEILYKERVLPPFLEP